MERQTFLACAIGAVCLASTSFSQAETLEKIKFVYLKTDSMVAVFHAERKGYFKDEGIDMEMIPVQGGPASAMAVSSGTAQIGFSASPPIIIAREQGQPFKMIVGMDWERTPDKFLAPLIASKRSGIKNLSELAGKTILTGPPGGLCELGFRDWLTKAGVAWGDVKILTNPFPQHQAMLADASCTPEPFYSALTLSKVKPVVLASGMLAEEKRKYTTAGLFSSDTWIEKNPEAILKVRRAIARSLKDLATDPGPIKPILVDEFRLPVADVLKPNLSFTLDLMPSDLEPIVEGMKRTGMINSNLVAADVVAMVK
jgi:NitT/TauT family transport system substrate-binding protein